MTFIWSAPNGLRSAPRQRKLPHVLPVDNLAKELRRKNEPVIEAVAFQGPGVFETLKEIARQVPTELKQGG